MKCQENDNISMVRMHYKSVQINPLTPTADLLVRILIPLSYSVHRNRR